VGHKIQDATEYTNHVLEHDHAASAASAHRDYHRTLPGVPPPWLTLAETHKHTLVFCTPAHLEHGAPVTALHLDESGAYNTLASIQGQAPGSALWLLLPPSAWARQEDGTRLAHRHIQEVLRMDVMFPAATNAAPPADVLQRLRAGEAHSWRNDHPPVSW
jgi:hypothetical protein